jgi:hypothetical protein
MGTKGHQNAKASWWHFAFDRQAAIKWFVVITCSYIIDHQHPTRNTNRSNRGGPRQNPNPQTRQAKIPIPDTDFDFEGSNAKFNRSEMSGGPNDADYDSDDPARENFYEKSSSFFDNISCEAKDRAENTGE